MKLLALKWRGLGDTVLWTSALEALRSLPETRVDIAYPQAYADLFLNDARFPQQYRLGKNIWDSRAVLTEIRAASYDLILIFHASSRGRLFALLSGAKRRGLHHHDRRGKRFGSQVPIPHLGKVGPATERDLNLVRGLGWQGQPPQPKLIPNATQVEKASHLLSRLRIEKKKPLIVISPFASRPAKQWSLSRYLELGTSLQKNCDVIFLHESPRQFASQSEWKALTTVGHVVQTPALGDALGIISQAQVFVGSDSGLKHCAIALGKHTVTLFGPESPGEWHPYSLTENPILQNAVGCRDEDADDPRYAWCGKVICPLGSHACLLMTSAEDVRREIERLLSLN